MKQLLIITSLMLFSIVSYADSTSIGDKVSNVITSVDTSSISKQIYSDIKGVVVGLADALKVGSEHVYKILVKQQIVNSVIYIILLLFGLYFIYNFIKAYKDKDEEWEYDSATPSGISIVRILQIIVGGIMFFVGIINIDVIITGFINPEYGAIEKILNILKK